MPKPTVNIATGLISYQPNDEQWLNPGQEFAWVTNVAGNVWVKPVDGPNSQKWFTPSNGVSFTGPATGPLANGSNVATASSDMSGEPFTGWQYQSNVNQNNGRVVVKSGKMEQAKAS